MKRFILLILLAISVAGTISAQTASTDTLPGIRYKNSVLRIGTPFNDSHNQIQLNDLGALQMITPDYYLLRIQLHNASKAYIWGGNVYEIIFRNLNNNIYNSIRVGTVYTNANPPRVEIEDLPDNVPGNIIARLEPVSFQFKGTPEKHLGFIAQDVEKIAPELVKATSDGLKSIDIYSMIPLLVHNISNLNSTLEANKESLAIIQEKLLRSQKSSKFSLVELNEAFIKFRHSYSLPDLTISVVTAEGNLFYTGQLTDAGSDITISRDKMEKGVYFAVLSSDGKVLDSVSFKVD